MDTSTFICFVIITTLLVVISIKLHRLGKLYDSWQMRCLHYEKIFTDIEWHRVDDLGKLADTNKRIQDLEDRLEAHAAELTEHHNKIDTLEINGSVYESLFEQQGLWGEDKE